MESEEKSLKLPGSEASDGVCAKFFEALFDYRRSQRIVDGDGPYILLRTLEAKGALPEGTMVVPDYIDGLSEERVIYHERELDRYPERFKELADRLFDSEDDFAKAIDSLVDKDLGVKRV